MNGKWKNLTGDQVDHGKHVEIPLKAAWERHHWEDVGMATENKQQW